MSARPRGFGARLRLILDMIQFSHTLFALPFALLGMMLAARAAEPSGWPGWGKLLLILLCMVTARSAAMAYNRIADRDIDAANPRTADRALASGLVDSSWAWGFVFVNSVLFIFCAVLLGKAPGRLSPAVLAWIFAYSHAKRFTVGVHFWLGISLAIAPIGAWLAIRGELAGAPWLLAGAVLAWVAGFDLIYSLQDRDFDRHNGLHSLGARLGPGGALPLAAACHGVMIVCLILLGSKEALGLPYWTALVLASLLLLWEHRIVRGGDLRRIDLAFFRINSWVGVVVFLGGALGIVLG